MTTKLAATLAIYTARTEGLTNVIRSAAAQDFEEPWELLIVDGAWGERHELVKALWGALLQTDDIVHVPPLDPIGRDYYHSWDIPLYQHTAWAHARGEVIVQAEDFCSFGPSWLRLHVEFVRKHPNLASIGHVFDAETGTPHYNRKLPAEMLDDWLVNYPDIRDRHRNPQQLGCVNAQAYGAWLSGNTGLWMEHVIKAGPYPERPTHYPESNNITRLFQYGLSMWPLEYIDLAHQKHLPGGIVRQVAYKRDAYGDLVYRPVKVCAFTDPAIEQEPLAWRDIAVERKRLDRWIP